MLQYTLRANNIADQSIKSSSDMSVDTFINNGLKNENLIQVDFIKNYSKNSHKKQKNYLIELFALNTKIQSLIPKYIILLNKLKDLGFNLRIKFNFNGEIDLNKDLLQQIINNQKDKNYVNYEIKTITQYISNYYILSINDLSDLDSNLDSNKYTNNYIENFIGNNAKFYVFPKDIEFSKIISREIISKVDKVLSNKIALINNMEEFEILFFLNLLEFIIPVSIEDKINFINIIFVLINQKKEPYQMFFIEFFNEIKVNKLIIDIRYVDNIKNIKYLYFLIDTFKTINLETNSLFIEIQKVIKLSYLDKFFIKYLITKELMQKTLNLIFKNSI